MKVSPYWFLVQKLICCSPKLKRRTTTFSSPNVPVTSFLTSKRFAYSLSFLDFFCFTFIPLAHPRYNIEAKLFTGVPSCCFAPEGSCQWGPAPFWGLKQWQLHNPCILGLSLKIPTASWLRGHVGAHTASAGWHSTVSVQQHAQHT